MPSARTPVFVSILLAFRKIRAKNPLGIKFDDCEKVEKMPLGFYFLEKRENPQVHVYLKVEKWRENIE